MAHDNVVLSTKISYGSRGGPVFNTDVIRLDSGAESRIGRQQVVRHRYDVSYGIKSIDLLYTLKQFYIARLGALKSFNYKDFFDYASTADGRTTASNGSADPSKTDQTLGPGTGSQTVFQLIKTYTDGVVSRDRDITKPKNGTVLVAVDTVLQTEGADYTVNYTTGEITFDAGSIPGGGTSVTAGFEFYVPVRFDADDEWLSASYEAFDSGDVPIILEEVNNGLDVPEEYFYGGALEDTLTADRQMTVSEARLWVLLPDASGHKLKLPDATNLQPGGPYFYIINESNSNTISITKSDGTTAVKTLGINSAVTIVLSEDNANNKIWYAF